MHYINASKLLISGTILALVFSILTITGLGERWGLNVFGKQEVATRESAPLVPASLATIGRIPEAPGRFTGTVKSIDQEGKQIAIDLSFGLAKNELILAAFSDDTHFWKALVQKATLQPGNGDPLLVADRLPLVYYRQANSIEKMKIGDILMVEVKEWRSIAPPETKVEAKSVGVFEKVSPEIKNYLRLRYGEAAEKIESY